MKQLLILITAVSIVSCGQQQKVKMEANENQATQVSQTTIPKASDFVDSPLRNRIRLELNAPVEEVWALVGKLERMPEYSAGLKKLEASYNDADQCTEFTCYFFPMEEGGEVTTHRETIEWFEAKVGFASLAEEPNLLGLQQSLGIVTFEEKGEKTILQWDVHFTAPDAESLQMNVAGFEQALNMDIAQNLIKTFGGSVLESFINKT